MNENILLAQTGIEIIITAGLVSASASLVTAIATWLGRKKSNAKVELKYTDDKGKTIVFQSLDSAEIEKIKELLGKSTKTDSQETND